MASRVLGWPLRQSLTNGYGVHSLRVPRRPDVLHMGEFLFCQFRLHGDVGANFYHRWKDDFQIEADAPAVHDFVEQMLAIWASLDGRDGAGLSEGGDA